MSYAVKEVFRSLQGEGYQAGLAMTFIRFAGCNLACSEAVEGFACDTDYAGGERMTASEIAALARPGEWVSLTGGEPTLQVDVSLIAALSDAGALIHVETNGTVESPALILADYVVCSPKPGSRVLLRRADEVRVVVSAAGETPDDHGISARRRYVSPAHGSASALRACIQWCLDHPSWRLSTQQHKQWGIA